MDVTKPDPRWMRIAETNQLPQNSTQITDGGMYRFEAATTVYIIISDAAITDFPPQSNCAVICRGEYETQYQYIAPGQFIRCNTTSGSMVKLG